MKNKKIIFAGLVFTVFFAVALSANSANAGFWDWFKGGSDNTAAVAKAAKIALGVEKNGKGTVTSNDGKINCGSDCKEVYSSGGSVVLTATPAEGFTFDKWTGNACLDTGYEYKDVTIGHCTVSLEGKSKTLTAKAHFKKVPSSSSSSKSSSSRSSKSSSSSKSSTTSASTYTLKINKSGKGRVSDGGRLNCGTSCKDTYWAGAEVKLMAVPNGGYVFEKFSPEKECSSVYSGGFGLNDNKLTKQAFAYGPAENVICVTTMNKNKTITAVFKKIPSSSSSRSSKSFSSKAYSSKSN